MTEISLIIGTVILWSVPLLIGALAGMFSERSGVINIALEGIMIVGGLMGVVALSSMSDSAWAIAHPQWAALVGFLIAGLAGAVYSLLLSFAAVNLKADQTITGTALNIFAPAFAVILAWSIQGVGYTDIDVPSMYYITPATFGLDATTVPIWLRYILFRNSTLSLPIAIVIFIVSYILLYKTKIGLRLRACGEHPQAADSVGINVYRMRYLGVTISGFLSGIAGLAFALALKEFTGEVLGYGFLALAVMIFGNWKPLNILFAAIFFSLFKSIGALASSLAFLPTFGLSDSMYIYKLLPYVLTLTILAFTSKKSRAPKAEGIPYDAGKR